MKIGTIQFCRQNMLRPYLKIWEQIFGCAVKTISSLGIRSLWVYVCPPYKIFSVKTLEKIRRIALPFSTKFLELPPALRRKKCLHNNNDLLIFFTFCTSKLLKEKTFEIFIWCLLFKTFNFFFCFFFSFLFFSFHFFFSFFQHFSNFFHNF